MNKNSKATSSKAYSAGTRRAASSRAAIRKPRKGWTMMDAERRPSRRHPENLFFPDDQTWRNVPIGRRVKIGLEPDSRQACQMVEPFWVDIVAKRKTAKDVVYTAKVFSRVICPHGIYQGDLVEFRERHILAIVD
jgi:hypothetical protein